METKVDRVVLVLLDSLNRHMLSAYAPDCGVDTPNLDRLAARGRRFMRHYSGSLPCIPARHDLLCGALDFLWKPWGSIEQWERPITHYLRQAGVMTQLITDHPHLFEHGGENYHCDFGAWDYQRGHEGDPWQTRVDPSMLGTPTFGLRPPDNAYHKNRRMFRREEDFPGPKTMAAAARWLREEGPAHDRFLLFVDEFDPHEPFDTPEPYASRYDPDWREPHHLIWPPYLVGDIEPRQAQQLRAQYAGKLTMIDRWLGEVLAALDETDLWSSTLVIVTSDHGHYLGEHGRWGKPPSLIYDTLGHIPLIACHPALGKPGSRVEALSTNVDLCETLLANFGVTRTRQQRHGRSLLALMAGDDEPVRDHVLQGYWGQRVNLVTPSHKLARGVHDPAALSIYSNRWSTMPPFEMPKPDNRAELGAFMPGSDIPVIRQPLRPDQSAFFIWSVGDHSGDVCFDLAADPGEEHAIADARLVEQLTEQLAAALTAVAAPAEQRRRLGL